MNNITGYTHFRSYHDSIKDLDKEDKRDILEAIDDFMFEDIEPELVGFKNSIWMLIKPNLVSSKNKSRKYQDEPKKKQSKTKSKSKSNQKETKNKSIGDNSFEIDILENKDMDEDMEMNKEENNEMNNISSMSTTNIYEFLEENFGRTITSLEYEKLNSWIESFNEEMVRHGIKSAVLNGVKKFSYLEAIFRNWTASGYKTLNDVLEHEEQFHKPREERLKDLDDIFDYNWLEEGLDD